jgi:hypothetical protein
MEKYIKTAKQLTPGFSAYLDALYIDPTKEHRGQTTINGKYTKYGNDLWVKEGRRINPEWREIISYILIYGYCLEPHILIVVACKNKLLHKQAKLRRAINNIVKSETGVLIKDQDWLYAGVEDKPQDSKHPHYILGDNLDWKKQQL